MTLPTSPVTAINTINSYLYFQYQDDQDLPALIASYNAMTQDYVTWFADISLPVYTGLSGALLDWIGQGVYGLPRPDLSSSRVTGRIGQLASFRNHGPIVVSPSSEINGPLPNIVNAIATTQIYVDENVVYTPDDIYQRILTWWFYKGDGDDFSISWLKRRMARFIYGIRGTDVCPPWNPGISVTFNESAVPLVQCEITLDSVLLPGIDGNVLTFLKLAIEGNVLLLPFQFSYQVTIT